MLPMAKAPFIGRAKVGAKMRPTSDEYFMAMACLCAARGTCVRRRVGCVLVSEQKHVLATGYNGRPAHFVHCAENSDGCPGATAPSGTHLDGCGAIHAEANALLQCKDRAAIHTVYATTAPCWECTKLFLNTGAKRIVFLEDYSQAQRAHDLWAQGSRYVAGGNSWEQFVPSMGSPLFDVYSIHKAYEGLQRG